jgi:BirA family biotin operon repressor/biotin-[acetyl-CoA-carboxylase] ligase
MEMIYCLQKLTGAAKSHVISEGGRGMALKTQILSALVKHRDADLSGQVLAERLNVSRTAVWKAINALRRDGYEIKAVTNSGYRLIGEDDRITARGISAHLDASIEGTPVFVLPEVDSTNNEARRMAASGYSQTALIAADAQLAGKGRMGRPFYSHKGAGIYLSVLFHTQAQAADAVSVTVAASVAVVRAIEKLTGHKPLIKWVNDLFLDGKKIGGILTEAVSDLETGHIRTVVVGIGLNVRQMPFPDDLEGIAGVLELEGVSRNRLIAQIANELLPMTENLSDRSYMQDYRARSLVLGKEVTYRQNSLVAAARVLDIDDAGGLVVVHEDGSTQVLHSGEITLRPAPPD